MYRVDCKTVFVLSLFIVCFACGDDMQIITDRLKDEAMRGADAALTEMPDLLNKMKNDGSFDDLKYKSDTDVRGAAKDIREFGKRIHKLAQAYCLKKDSNSYYKNHDLKMKINKCLNYLAYNAPDNLQPNWWWIQKIGIPNIIWQGMMLMRSEVDYRIIIDVLDKYYKKTGCWDLENKKDSNAGGNLTDRAMAALVEAVFRNNPNRIREITRIVENDVVNYGGWYGSGLQPDYSVHQHPIMAGGLNPMLRVQLYTGGYGATYAIGLAKLTVWLHGTNFAFSPEFEGQVLHFILDGQQWFMRGKTFEPTSVGRGISRKGSVISDRADEMKTPSQELLVLNKRKDELQKYIARLDGSVSKENYLYGNRCFWTSDFIVHHRKNFMASVRMVSERTLRPETWSNENKKGYYMGDGFTAIIKDGDEYGRTIGMEIFPIWDWLLLPGTTTEDTRTVPFEHLSVCDPKNNPNLAHHTGTKKFVGGVSDGQYGMAVMDFCRGPVNVTAKKAWFFFDDEFVALGTAINAAGAGANNNVRTCVNQVLKDGDVVFYTDRNEKILEPNSTANPKNIRWVHHDGIGYIFLNDQNNVFVCSKKQKGKWEDIGEASGCVENDVFTVWINHGIRPTNAEYAYIVVPGIAKADISKYSDSLLVEILCNTADIQAVWHRQKKITQAAFYQQGLLKIDSELSIEVDKPSAVMVRRNRDNIAITASNPEREALLLHIDINAELYGESVEYIKDKSVSRITFNLPGDLYAGSSQVKILKIQSE